MKEGIHPNYREVCFLDLSNNFKFVTRSCVNAKDKITMDDGRELPLYKLDTSSESHPFYTTWVAVWSAFAIASAKLPQRQRLNKKRKAFCKKGQLGPPRCPFSLLAAILK